MSSKSLHEKNIKEYATFVLVEGGKKYDGNVLKVLT